MLDLEINSQYIGERLDSTVLNVLKENNVEVPSRSFLQENWGDWLKVNDSKKKTSYKLREGDGLSIDMEYIKKMVNDIDRSDNINSQEGELDIIYEDDNYLVLNKPKGTVVHPGVGNKENTLANYVKRYLEDTCGYDKSLERAGIVHRLDKGVSGLIVFAKNSKAQRDLKEQFENHIVQKLYLAKVIIQSPNKENEQIFKNKSNLEEILESFSDYKDWYKAEGYVGRNSKSRVKMTFKSYEFPGSKYALTYMQAVGEDKVVLKIETGRMHQIRATLKALGMYIDGDTLYENSSEKHTPESIELESIYLGFKDLDGKEIRINLLKK